MQALLITPGSEDGKTERELTIQDGDGIQTVSDTHTDELKSLRTVTRQGVVVEVGASGSTVYTLNQPVQTFNLPEVHAFLGFQRRSGKRIDRPQVDFAKPCRELFAFCAACPSFSVIDRLHFSIQSRRCSHHATPG